MLIRILMMLLVFVATAGATSVDTVWVRDVQATFGSSFIEAKHFLDASGNVYVSWGSETIADDTTAYYTSKIGNNGNIIWARALTHSGDGCRATLAADVVSDQSGDVYVAGRMECPQQGSAYAFGLVKYSASGDTLWTRSFHDGASFSTIEVTDMILDRSGNPYITGMALTNLYLIKYLPNGDTAWVRVYNGGGNGLDRGNALATDSAGNIYVVGTTYSGTASLDIVLLKYDSQGSLLWERRYDSEAADYGSGIAIDDYGDICVVGSSRPAGSGSNIVVVKYTAAGTELWARIYGKLEGVFATGTALAVDADRNIFVTGNRYLVAKYSPDGSRLWVSVPSANILGEAHCMVADSQGSVIVSGEASNAGHLETGIDYYTRKLTSEGLVAWEHVYHAADDSLRGGADRVASMGIDGSGDLLVTGTVSRSTGLTASTIKYRQQNLAGDADADGSISTTDCVYVISYIFAGGPVPLPLSTGDANCSGSVNISDVVFLLLYIFGGGPAPCQN